MTHVYSAGSSGRTAVFTAIFGLHFAVFLIVLHDRVPGFRDAAREPGSVTVLPPEPQQPVLVPPDELLPAEPTDRLAEEPDLVIPAFPELDDSPLPPVSGGDAWDGTQTLTVPPVERVAASLQRRSNRFADVVRACYPAGARRDGEEGRLILAVTIGALGQARSWRVAESTGFSRLDAAAQCVLDKLRFNAARADGRAVESEVRLPIAFRLD